MKVLVTGSAGFIGSALSIRLLDRGDEVIGVDNHNDYYDPALKEARLARHANHPNYTHIRINLEDREAIAKLFEDGQFDGVVNLAAQAGVRYSLENPLAYIDTNLVGFSHVLEGCRHNKVGHLVYASSSSVYGDSKQFPLSEEEVCKKPLSLYGASKLFNELTAYSYSHLYNISSIGLRFFTVYGPWGRPDMALFKFTRGILENEPIPVFNRGEMVRDFTYVDDIVEGVVRVIDQPAERSGGANEPDRSASAPWRIFNIGNSHRVPLMDYIQALEKALGQQAILDLLPMQDGDVPATEADVTALESDLGYRPKVKVEEGIQRFVDWYRSYYMG